MTSDVIEFSTDRSKHALQLLELPPILFNPYRILIMSEINLAGGAEYIQLKHDLQMTDGNLVTHLKVLESAGYVKQKKEVARGKRSRTTYVMTKKGKLMFDNFISAMRQAFTAGAAG